MANSGVDMFEPVNTNVLALIYMLEGFAGKVLDKYKKAQDGDVMLGDMWILSMAKDEVVDLYNECMEEASDGVDTVAKS